MTATQSNIGGAGCAMFRIENRQCVVTHKKCETALIKCNFWRQSYNHENIIWDDKFVVTKTAATDLQIQIKHIQAVRDRNTKRQQEAESTSPMLNAFANALKRSKK